MYINAVKKKKKKNLQILASSYFFKKKIPLANITPMPDTIFLNWFKNYKLKRNVCNIQQQQKKSFTKINVQA
jgi:hypothetical protein